MSESDRFRIYTAGYLCCIDASFSTARVLGMCGRYALTTSPEILRALLYLRWLKYDVVSRYNIAPTQTAPVARLDENQDRELVGMRWSLVPSWAKDISIGARMINARSETAATKPSFRAAMKKRRCVVPASGFYEWKKLDSRGKQPYYISRADDQPLLMAGLWERWTDPDKPDTPLETFTVLTTDANDEVGELHDRMPVILEPEDVGQWFEGKDVGGLLRSAASGVLGMYPVSTKVNSPKNDDPSLLNPIEESEDDPDGSDRGGLFG